ncbi:MAG: M23 family metallopeptidase [bacterium]|nr:M23 family metallopeptidase [bacterium]
MVGGPLAWIPLLGHRPVFLAVALGVFAFCALFSYLVLDGEDRAADPAAAAAGEPFRSENPLVEQIAFPSENSKPPEVPVRSSELDVVTGRVTAGGSIASSLASMGVPAGTVHTIAEAMRPVFDFRGAHAGDFFALIRDDRGEIISFEFQRGRRKIYRVEANSEGMLAASEAKVPLERRVVQLGGVIDNSLSKAVLGLGEHWNLVQSFADIFVWDVDFSTQSRPGDEFRLVFEKFYDRDGFVRYGKILAAEYRAAQRTFVAVYFEDDEGEGNYYTPDGNSVRRPFLRAPVHYTRISSRYSKSRLHPILKIRRPHEGIDYAAPTGTPVWAVAGGEVSFVGWSGGFGRLVKIRHNNGYTSYYGHLSRYAKDLKRGMRVEQKRVIGYVGKTGLATGPHLDYRLKYAGRFQDPSKVKFPMGEPISVKARERFEETKQSRLAELRDAQPPLVLEAAM